MTPPLEDAAPIVGQGAHRAARRCLLDWLGCALGGSRLPSAEAVHGLVAKGSGPCTILARPHRASPRDAAFVNATAGHALDLDDELAALHGHPAATVVPAALAVAEQADLTVGRLLRALVRGYETASDLGRHVNPGHYVAGWHATATLGAVAAADACGLLLDCSDDAREGLRGLAAVQAAGIRAAFGSDAKPIQVGNAASVAVTAAELSRSIRCDAITTLQPYLRMVTSEAPARSYAVHRGPSGERWAIENTAFKVHAACGAAHCIIDAVARITGEHNIHTDAITRLVIEVAPLTAQTASITQPSTAQQVQFCLPYLAALATERYPIGFGDLWPVSPAVHRLATNSQVTIAQDLGPAHSHPARVVATLHDGRVIPAEVAAARGSVTAPLTDDELGSKFVELASTVTSSAHATRLVRWLRRCPESTGVRHMMATIQDAIALPTE